VLVPLLIGRLCFKYKLLIESYLVNQFRPLLIHTILFSGVSHVSVCQAPMVVSEQTGPGRRAIGAYGKRLSQQPTDTVWQPLITPMLRGLAAWRGVAVHPNDLGYVWTPSGLTLAL
jgi:hypothetical protein